MGYSPLVAAEPRCALLILSIEGFPGGGHDQGSSATGCRARPVLLGKLLGEPYDGSAAARARMAAKLPVVGLRR